MQALADMGYMDPVGEESREADTEKGDETSSEKGDESPKQRPRLTGQAKSLVDYAVEETWGEQQEKLSQARHPAPDPGPNPSHCAEREVHGHLCEYACDVFLSKQELSYTESVISHTTVPL